MKRIAIIGATSAIAVECAKLWAKQPTKFYLVGRQLTGLQRVSRDLQVRHREGLSFHIRTANFSEPHAIKKTVDEICQEGPLDIVLIAHGSLPDQLECQENLELCKETLDINGVSPVLFAEAFAIHFERWKSGTLAVIGSVAGDRGRRSNYVYGAAKGLVSRYVQGLQHRFANTGVHISLIKPGPTETPMTAKYKAAGMKLAKSSDVARRIVKEVNAGKAQIYAPSIWRFIMLIIKHIPDCVFKRLDI